MGLKVAHNWLLQFLKKDDASRSAHLKNEINLIATKLLQEVDESRRNEESENYPRFLLSQKALSPE
jgi:hypothetical protein